MAAYSVLLKHPAELPHMELGEGIANITGEHKQNAFSRLRNQHGIVWDRLDEAVAGDLATFLTDQGFPAVTVPDSDVVTFGKPLVCRNADIHISGIEVEDPYGNRKNFGPEWIAYAHAGFIMELEKSPDGKENYMGDLTSTQHGVIDAPGWKWKDSTDSIGWVLQIFSNVPSAEYLRIFGRRFNYDYQGAEFAPLEERFTKLLNDLSVLIPEEHTDPGYKIASEILPKAPEEVRYETVDDLMQRIQWSMTLHRIEK